MKNQNSRTLSLLAAGLVLFLPLFVSAQPGGSPPTGNVDANFNSVTVEQDLNVTDGDINLNGAGKGVWINDSLGGIFNAGGLNQMGSIFRGDGTNVKVLNGLNINDKLDINGFGELTNSDTGVLFDDDNLYTACGTTGKSSYFSSAGTYCVNPIKIAGRGLAVDGSIVNTNTVVPALLLSAKDGIAISSENDGLFLIEPDGSTGEAVFSNEGGDIVRFGGADSVVIGSSAASGLEFSSNGDILDGNSDVTINDSVDITGDLGVGTTSPAAKVHAIGSTYGVRGDGSTAGGYFTDTNSTGYAFLGYGMRGVQAYGSNGSYFYNLNTGSNGEIGALQSGVEAYGNTQGGYFADLSQSGYARIGTGDYGVMGFGNTMGGYFQDRNNTSTYANIANGSYGLMGYGAYGVYGGGTSMGGYFNDTDSSGRAYVANGDRGIDATGSYTGGTFRNSSGVWADLASSSYSLIASSSIYLNSGQAYKPGGGSWASSSDIRLKDVDGEYIKGLDEILQLDPVEFHYKKDNELNLPSDEDYVGFVAQDVQKVIPEAISEGDNGYLFLDMHPLNVAVINAIQEIVSMIDTNTVTLRAELAEQKSEIEELRQIVCELKPEHTNCR